MALLGVGLEQRLPIGPGQAHLGGGVDHIAQADLLLQVGEPYVDGEGRPGVEGVVPALFALVVVHLPRRQWLALAVGVAADGGREADVLAVAERNPLLQRGHHDVDLAGRADLHALAAVVLRADRVIHGVAMLAGAVGAVDGHRAHPAGTRLDEHLGRRVPAGVKR